jgi:hypothetical protein
LQNLLSCFSSSKVSNIKKQLQKQMTLSAPKSLFFITTLFFLWALIAPKAFAATTYVSGPLTQDTTWTTKKSPVVVGEGFVVPPGVTLTINAGVVVKFARVSTQPQILGDLIVKGYEDKKVKFTSLQDDSIGGDTNGDGAASTPTNNDWSLYFGPNSDHDSTYLENMTVRYMDRLSIDNRYVHATNINLKYSNNGFTLSNTAALDGFGIIASNFANSVFLIQDGSEVNTTFSTFDLTGSTADSFLLFNNSKFSLGNSQVSNAPAGKTVLVSFGSDTTFEDVSVTKSQGSGAVLFNNPTLSHPSSLTLNYSSFEGVAGDGVIAFDHSVVNMNTGRIANVGGMGVGLFDSVASLDKSTVTQGGDSAISLFDTSHFALGSTLDAEGSEISQFTNIGITSFDGAAHIKNSVIVQNGTGIQASLGRHAVGDEPFEVTGSDVFGNGVGIEAFINPMDDSVYEVQATGNWWGDETGPFNNTQNCTGKGNSVSSGVAFSPWAASANYQTTATADPNSCQDMMSGQSEGPERNQETSAAYLRGMAVYNQKSSLNH